jgi:hypothetical protein
LNAVGWNWGITKFFEVFISFREKSFAHQLGELIKSAHKVVVALFEGKRHPIVDNLDKNITLW